MEVEASQAAPQCYVPSAKADSADSPGMVVAAEGTLPDKTNEEHADGDDVSECSVDSCRPRNVFSRADLMAIAVRNCEAMLASCLGHVECEEDLKNVLWLLELPSETLLAKLLTFTRQNNPEQRFYAYLKLKQELETMRLAPMYSSRRDARQKAHSLVEFDRRCVEKSMDIAHQSQSACEYGVSALFSEALVAHTTHRGPDFQPIPKKPRTAAAKAASDLTQKVAKLSRAARIEPGTGKWMTRRVFDARHPDFSPAERSRIWDRGFLVPSSNDEQPAYVKQEIRALLKSQR